jgi:hypothetical protein
MGTTRKVTLGSGRRYDTREGVLVADPVRITVLYPDRVGDPLIDTALAMLWHSSTLRVRDFAKRFAATGLYERVRAGRPRLLDLGRP